LIAAILLLSEKLSQGSPMQAGMKFNLNEDGSSTLGDILGTDMGTIQF
jgi:hypothetical protein